jgi:endonuclease III
MPRDTPAAPRRLPAAAAAGDPAAEPTPPRRAARRPAAPLHGSASAPRRARRMSAEQAAAFVRALAAANPAPETELLYGDPFSLLVAVVLSAQTTDAAVNRATPALFAAAPDPAAMAALGEEGIGPFIRSIGLWQGKARNVAALARLLVERHGGQVPRDREALEALPGVGRKTANVVLNVAFGESTMAVDTHIFRIGNRTGLAPGRTPREVEDGLVRRCPPELLRDAHHWLILHGRYVCKARRPECWRCPAAAHCNYRDKVAAAPAVGASGG